MKNKILITGSRGIIGQVAIRQLGEYFVTEADLPENDVTNLDNLIKISAGHSIIMHFAWDSKIENAYTKETSPKNCLMANNIYNAALVNKIPRVIMASSIHTDDYTIRGRDELLSPYRLPTPKNPYGATKAYIEALGRYFARQGLEVICLRLGSVTPDNKPSSSSSRFLSNNDFGNLLKCCIKIKKIPNNYSIIYGISNNSNRIHDIANPIGWIPKDDASLFF